MHKLRTIVAACTVAAGAVAALAQTTPDQPNQAPTPGSTSTPNANSDSSSSMGNNPSGQSTLSMTERSFMNEVAQSGHAEVQASRLAKSHASAPEVKEFAQQMVDDHTRANAKLQQIAQAKGVNLPTEPSFWSQRKLNSLEEKNGAKFDRQYMDDFGVDAHRKTVERFRKEAENGQDPDLKSFAQETLPTLEKHLQHAMDTQSSLKHGMTRRSDTSTKGPQS